MAIVALAGKNVSLTLNGQVWRITKGTIKVGNEVIKFFTTGETADADGNVWMNKLAGINDWTISGEGYLDFNAVPANRAIGATYAWRPGLSASGTLIILFAVGFGISGNIVVSDWSPSFDAENSSKPNPFSFAAEGNGAMTYVNA